MSLKKKLASAEETTWLFDSLSNEERSTAEFIASIAASIQTERKAQGLTQKEFGDKLNVSQAIVSRWENGEENFTVATLARISAALGIALQNPLSSRPA